MKIETTKDKIKLTFSKNAVDLAEIQNFVDYVKFREINSQSKATQKQADELADEINQAWWEKNKNKFE